MKLIKNIRLYDFEQYIESGFVVFNKQIEKVAPMKEYVNYIEETRKKNTDIEEIDGNGALLLPGLVLGHTHIYSTFARGWLTPYSPHSFQDVLDQLWWKLDRALGKEEIYYSGLTSGYQYIKQGITTVIDHHASGQMIKDSLRTLKKAVVDDIGLRGIFCFETSDRFDINECIEENRLFFEEMARLNNNDACGLLGLHASFSLSDESLHELSRTPLAMPIHVHVAESVEDVEWTKNNCGKSILERFNHYGLLREDSIYAHGVHLEEKDFQLIKETNGYMAFNPSSNMNNGVGLPPVDLAIEYGIPWLVGNDGLGSGLSRDYQTIIFSSNLKGPNHFPLQELQKSILASYEYASKQLGCKLGRIKTGYEADFMLVPYETITPMTENNAFGHFVYGVLERPMPKEVWVKGEHKLSQFEFIGDVTDSLNAALVCADKLWSKI